MGLPAESSMMEMVVFSLFCLNGSANIYQIFSYDGNVFVEVCVFLIIISFIWNLYFCNLFWVSSVELLAYIFFFCSSSALFLSFFIEMENQKENEMAHEIIIPPSSVYVGWFYSL